MIEELSIRLANKISRRNGISKEQVVFLALVNYIVDFSVPGVDEDLEALLDALQHLIPGENILHETRVIEKLRRNLELLYEQDPLFCENTLSRFKAVCDDFEEKCA